MAKQKPLPKRETLSRHQTITVKLSQIQLETDGATQGKYCHRQDEALAPEKLEGLINSLVQEGQKTPLTIYKLNKQDASGEPLYGPVSGHRRFHALHKACEDKLDPERIHDDMLLTATEITQGPDQDDGSFRADILVASVAENEQRANFTLREKLDIVRQFEQQGVSRLRAASALGVSETQYKRLLAVASRDWLYQYVIGDDVKMSYAAELIVKVEDKAGKEVYEEDWFKEDLDCWVAEHRKKLDVKKANLVKAGKKAENAGKVSQWFDVKLFNHWAQCIDKGGRLGGQPQFAFGVLIQDDKIVIPGRTYDMQKLRAKEYRVLIAEMQAACAKLIKPMRERSILEEAEDLDPQERQQLLAEIAQEYEQEQKAQEESEAGRAAPGFNEVEEPHPEPIENGDLTEEDGE